MPDDWDGVSLAVRCLRSMMLAWDGVLFLETGIQDHRLVWSLVEDLNQAVPGFDATMVAWTRVRREEKSNSVDAYLAVDRRQLAMAYVVRDGVTGIAVVLKAGNYYYCFGYLVREWNELKHQWDFPKVGI